MTIFHILNKLYKIIIYQLSHMITLKMENMNSHQLIYFGSTLIDKSDLGVENDYRRPLAVSDLAHCGSTGCGLP